jgi:hypothetical protein
MRFPIEKNARKTYCIVREVLVRTGKKVTDISPSYVMSLKTGKKMVRFLIAIRFSF